MLILSRSWSQYWSWLKCSHAYRSQSKRMASCRDYSIPSYPRAILIVWPAWVLQYLLSSSPICIESILWCPLKLCWAYHSSLWLCHTTLIWKRLTGLHAVCSTYSLQYPCELTHGGDCRYQIYVMHWYIQIRCSWPTMHRVGLTPGIFELHRRAAVFSRRPWR